MRHARGVAAVCLALLAFGGAAGLAEAANTYTVSLPASSAVTMAVPSPLNFTVTNTGNTDKISQVTLRFTVGDYTIANGTAPSGWSVTSITNKTSGGGKKIEIVYKVNDAACSTSAIGLGQSAVFGATITGTAVAADDLSDTLNGNTNIKNTCAGSTFTLQGSFPTWQRKGLEVALSASPSSLGVGGTITTTMTVTNRSTNTQNGIAPSALTASPGGLTGAPSSPSPASLNLTAGQSGTFTWTSTATSTGTVSFSASASNASVSSLSGTSDIVTISTLAASISADPVQVVSGQQVTVTMTVTNNGGSTLSNVKPAGSAPSITPTGTATKTYVSGPTPSSIASLAPGASANFSWTYTVAGSVGQTYGFQGSATANGGSTSNAATSNTGTLTTYTVTVDPEAVTVGSTNVTLAFTVINNGGLPLNRVTVTNPDRNKWIESNGSGFGCPNNPANATWSAQGWSYTALGGNPEKYQFDACTSSDQIAVGGGQKTIKTTFSSIPSLSSDSQDYSFTLALRDTASNTVTVGVTVTVTKYTITVTPSPTTVGADGQSTTTLTAHLTKSGTAVSGATIDFTTSHGTLSATSAVTNASGDATVTLTAPVSATDIAATVSAAYGTLEDGASVTFQGVVLALSASPATVDADGQSTSTATATVTQGGSALSGASVGFSTSTGSISPTSATTGGGGTTTSTFTAPVSGSSTSATLTSTYKGLTPVTTSVVLNGITLSLSASPATIGADGQSTSTVTVTLRRNGTGFSGAVSLSTTAGTLSSGSVTTNASGQATVTLTSSVSESSVTATVTGTYKGVSANTSVTFQAVVLTLSASPTTIPADGASTSTITVTVTQGGSALSGATVTLATTAGTLASTSLTTNASGQATTTLTSITSGSNVTATVTATYKGHQKTANVTFGALSLTLTASPASVAADGATTTTLTATLTSSGSGVSGRTVSFTTTGGTLSAGSAVTNSSGVATVTLRSTTASKSPSTPSVTASYGSLSAVQSVTLSGITIAEPTELSVVSNLGTNTVYWAWPSSGYINGVIVLRRSAGTPQVPADGTTLNVGNTLADGSVVIAKVASGGASSASETGLTAGTTYYYRIFGYFTSGALYSASGQSVDAPGTGTGAGQARWVVSASAGGSIEPTLDGNGGVVWGGAGGGLVDVNLSDGTRLWSPALTGEVVGGPLLLTDIAGQSGWYAIVGTTAGTVAAVDVATGTVLWETGSLGTAIGSAAVMQYSAYSNGAYQAAYGTNDLVIVGTKNASATSNKIYGLSAGTGAIQWTFNAAGGTAVDQVTGWGWVDHATNHVVMTTKSNGGTQPSLWALSTLNGSVVASWSIGDITAWLSLGMNGEVYIGTTSGKLYALDLATLGWKWTGPFDFGASNGLVGWVWEDWDDHGHLYLSTSSGQVWKLTTSGTTAPPTQAWKTAVAGATAPLVLVSQGHLWVGGSDGKIHQLRLSDGVDEKQATVGSGTAAVSAPSWDSNSGWLYVGTVAGKVFAIPTPLP